MANTVGFLAARRRAGGEGIHKTGNSETRRLIAYATRETHTWIEKIANLCGVGMNAIH
jgi:glutamate/tyrosine decarboxylase-like PLP-dependent enzyme